jgi:uncharacterized protein DUF6659
MVEERKHDAINDLDRPFLKDVSYDSNKAAVSLFKDIKAEEFAKNILSIDPKIRFAGLIERSGYLFAGGFREGVNHYLKRSNAELSLSQSAHIVYLRERFLTELGNLKYIVYDYDKVKLFSMPVKQHILVFSTESTASTEDVASKVSQYIKSMEHQLSLHPPSNIINKEKKETLRNLYESGFEEEVIADQLDLDLNTVRMLIKELYN